MADVPGSLRRRAVPPAPADQAVPRLSALRSTVAAHCAYGAGIGGIAGGLAFIGFYAFQIRHPQDAPLGTASDLSGVTIGLLIPAGLALAAYLPDRRSTRVIQAAGITAMAVAAVAGPLMVAGVLDFNVETPISAVSVLVLGGWIFAVSRMLQHAGAFRARVTRFGQAVGKAILAGIAIIVCGLPLPWMSVPQLIVFGAGALIGVVAWLSMPAWFLFLGQDLARVPRSGQGQPAKAGLPPAS